MGQMVVLEASSRWDLEPNKRKMPKQNQTKGNGKEIKVWGTVSIVVYLHTILIESHHVIPNTV